MRWLEYGRLLWRLHTELAADGLDFAVVASRGQELENFPEQARWSILHDLQQSYLRLLDRLELWDIQTARLVAVQRRECRTDCDLILVGTVDMTVLLRQMLDQVADRVTALVFAPESWSDRFDEHGCLTPSAWERVVVAVQDDGVHVVEGPAEQADRAARCLADFGGRYRADQITIGLADERTAPLVQRQLQQCGLRSRYAAGVAMSSTSPYRLVAAVQAFLRSGRYGDFAALVRHPDVGEYLQRQGVRLSWLADLDEYFGRHLQHRMGPPWPTDASGQSVGRAYSHLQRCLSGFDSSIRPLADWAGPLRELLGSMYGGRDWDLEVPEQRAVVRVLRRFQEVGGEHAETIPAELMPHVPAADALQLVMEQLHSDPLPMPADAGAVELAGWLELPLDDAPALIVCGLNEGYVPSSVNADLFLPDALRSRLGLQDNLRRYARDAYALSVLAATRERLELIVARRNLDGDPLIPSRLLFASDLETIAERARRYFAPPSPMHELPPLAGMLTADRLEPDFPIPRPQPLEEPLRALRVTALRDYLACPYRFYLRHILGLRPVDDAAEELDGAAFGNLLHDVMARFGKGPHRDSTDPGQIRSVLEELLRQRVAEIFDGRTLAAVEVQIEHLRQRLGAFAAFQAGWAEQGWQIRYTEVPPRGSAGSTFHVGNDSILLHGRIDRIDVHRDSGQVAVLDYKSSDSGKGPEAVHRRSGEWIDLQLPLYRHLLGDLGLKPPVRLGYLLLPKDLSQVKVEFADWSEQDLNDADQAARSVVRAIWDGTFWPPTTPPPDFSEDFAPICQDDVSNRSDPGNP
jgi:ATP-dependent helicase/nuclease subunit B